MLLPFIISAVTAVTYTLNKLLMMYTIPAFIVASRMLIAGSLFLGYHWYKGRSFKVRPTDQFLFIQVGFLSFCISFLAEIWALQYLSTAKVALLYNLAPFAAAAFSYVFFDEKMTIKKFIGLSIGFLGFIPILIASDINVFDQAPFKLPDLVMALAAICYTYGWIALRKLTKRRLYTVGFINGISMIIGGVCSFIVSYAWYTFAYTTDHTLSAFFPVSDATSFFALLIPLIAAGNLFSFYWYVRFLQRYTATFVTCVDLTGPIFSAFFGWLFLGEKVNVMFFLSCAAVLGGIYMFYQEELRQGYFEHE